METFWSILLIISLRLVDVSLGTVRIIMLSRRYRLLPAVIGFVEVFTWLVAATMVFSNLNSPPRMLAYAGGFALGTFLGTDARVLAGGGEHDDAGGLARSQPPGGRRRCGQAGFGVTVINADGRDGEVRLAFTIIPRRRRREAAAHRPRPRPDGLRHPAGHRDGDAPGAAGGPALQVSAAALAAGSRLLWGP